MVNIAKISDFDNENTIEDNLMK